MPNGNGFASSGRERALDYLRRVVVADPGSQGTHVNEQTVAEAVGVSRTPVREALLILASEGLVQMQPRRGAWIPPLTAREIHELMDLRGLIERHAVDRVLERTSSPHAAMDALLATQLRMSEGHDALGPDGPREFIELDRQFHQVLVDATGSDLLSRTYAGLRERQVRVGVSALSSGSARWHDVCTEHGAITAALADGDAQAARTAVDDHLERTLESLLRT